MISKTCIVKSLLLYLNDKSKPAFAYLLYYFFSLKTRNSNLRLAYLLNTQMHKFKITAKTIIIIDFMIIVGPILFKTSILSVIKNQEEQNPNIISHNYQHKEPDG